MRDYRIVINGVVYGNISEIKPEFEYEYYHNVRTLDGVLHQKKRYKVKSYNVIFYNLLTPVYYQLKDFIEKNEDENIVCGFPKDNGDIDNISDFDYESYKLSIVDEIEKGYLRKKYFRNGLSVRFELVSQHEVVGSYE